MRLFILLALTISAYARDDTDKLQKAIAGAGPTLVIPPGNYTVSRLTISSPITIMLGGATLTGSDPTAVIDILSSDVTLTNIGPVPSRIISTALHANTIQVEPGYSNITVSGLSIQAGGFAITMPGGGPPGRAQGDAIAIFGAFGNTCPTRADNVRISRNDISNAHSGVYLRCAQNSRIDSNIVRMDHPAFTGFNLHSSNTTTVTGNAAIATGRPSNGVEIIHLGDVPSTGNTVAGNTFRGNFDFEVVNLEGIGNTVSGNTLISTATGPGPSAYGSSPAGVRIGQPAGADTQCQTHNNVVANNIIRVGDTVAEGVGIKDEGSTGNFGANDNTVTSNTIYAPLGVSVSQGSKRNTVNGNSIDSTGFSVFPGDGISVQGGDASDTSIISNTVISSLRQGIYLNSTLRSDVRNNTVSNAKITGIKGDLCNLCSITGNTSSGSGSWGIDVYSCTSLAVGINTAAGNHDGQIAFNPANTTVTQ